MKISKVVNSYMLIVKPYYLHHKRSLLNKSNFKLLVYIKKQTTYFLEKRFVEKRFLSVKTWSYIKKNFVHFLYKFTTDTASFQIPRYVLLTNVEDLINHYIFNDLVGGKKKTPRLVFSNYPNYYERNFYILVLNVVFICRLVLHIIDK